MALVRSILLADGENLAIRYQALIASGRVPKATNVHIQDVFVWQPDPNSLGSFIRTDILRINYYSSVVGDDVRVEVVRDHISKVKYYAHDDLYGGCQLHPHVFKKLKSSTKSRRVDINIAIDAMRHAYTDAVDVIYLMSGDGDFLHLVEEIARSGKKVCVAAFSSGLETRLRSSVDHFTLLDDIFFEPASSHIASGDG